jgi:hypothetical protein
LVALEVFGRVSFKLRASSFTVVVPVVLIFNPWVPIGVRRISSSTTCGVRTEGIIIVVPVCRMTIS